MRIVVVCESSPTGVMSYLLPLQRIGFFLFTHRYHVKKMQMRIKWLDDMRQYAQMDAVVAKSQHMYENWLV